MQRLILPVLIGTFGFSAWSMNIDPLDQQPTRSTSISSAVAPENEVDEFDPSAPNAMETLQAYDQAYRAATGEETYSNFGPFAGLVQQAGGCERGGCHVFANVVKNEKPQMLYLYIDGVLATSWKVSTAGPGHSTPDWEGHPQGPFYAGAYTSHEFPEGDYHGLGNMPYAIFYKGGRAIHGTPSIGKLGVPASHGCVRSHPDNAKYFSQLVRSTGAAGVWVTVSQSRVNPAVNSVSMATPQ